MTRRGLPSTGGIGHVWLAYDKVLDREIAMKELKADQAGSEINRHRFFREAQITSQLTHPGTVPVYDYGVESGRNYYTMTFVRGCNKILAVLLGCRATALLRLRHR